MMPIGAHIMVHATLVGHRDVQSAVGTILDPYHIISTFHSIVPIVTFGGSEKCPPEKNRPS